MRSVFIAGVIAIFSAGAVPAAAAPQCRDKAGKFIKCPTQPAASGQRCKDAKGKFAKCGTPGAKPA